MASPNATLSSGTIIGTVCLASEGGGALPAYIGPTTVKSSASGDTVLQTANKSVYSNITVQKMELQDPVTVTPGQAQTITPASGKDGLSQVNVEAVPGDYVGEDIPHRSALNVSGASVTAQAGYYENGASATIDTGAVSVSATKSVDTSDAKATINYKASKTAGYITAGDVSGSVEVTAAELVDGNTDTIISNGEHDVTSLETVTVNVSSDTPETQEKSATPSESVQTITPDTGKLLSKVTVGAIQVEETRSVTPTETAQAITPDTGKYLKRVEVGAIPSDYVGTGVPKKTSANMTVSGATVTALAGYYAANASKTVAAGTEGTPTATKGAVSNHSVAVTPHVTNTAGYISGGTKDGTPVTVSASELVSGKLEISANGDNVDVTNYEKVKVAVQGGVNLYQGTKNFDGSQWQSNDTPWWDAQDTHSGFKAFGTSHKDVTYFQNVDCNAGDVFTLSGYVWRRAGADIAFISPNSNKSYEVITSQIPNAETYTKVSVTFTATADGVVCPSFATTVEGQSIRVCGLKLERGSTATDWTPSPLDPSVSPSLQDKSVTPSASQQVVEADTGYDGLSSVTVAGDANLTSGNIASGKTIFNVPGSFTSDANAAAADILSGKSAYVNGNKVSGTIQSKTAQTYTPGTTDQTIAAGQYLSGAQTVKGDANLVAANIAQGHTVFGVSGSFTSDANAQASDILAGKSAYVNGAKVNGDITIRTPDSHSYLPYKDSAYVINPGYYPNLAYVEIAPAEVAKLTEGNIAQGVTILGVQGTHQGGTTVQTATGTLATPNEFTALQGLSFVPDMLTLYLPDNYYYQFAAQVYLPIASFDMSRLAVGSYEQEQFAGTLLYHGTPSDHSTMLQTQIVVSVDTDGAVMVFSQYTPIAWTAYEFGLRGDD